jgi:hypothetical protein
MGKENVVYPHKEILYSHQKEETLPFVTTWNLENRYAR